MSNGFADGPAQALRDHLVGKGATVITVFHPLVREGGKRHEICRYEHGTMVRSRSPSFPVGPPLSFALDPFVPLRLPRVDTWFGFNSLACARGLLARRAGRARTVVQWCVDFVPDRFGRNPLTALYDAVDRQCCTKADLRVEMSEAAREGRDARHHLSGPLAPTLVVPMGAWISRAPTTDASSFKRRQVVYMGHLVPRQGVQTLLEAIRVLRDRGSNVTAHIVGGGPLESTLRREASLLGLHEAVRFHGFVPDHRLVERLLADASVAVAPYLPAPDSFTRFADPGKLKAYLAAGLPILLTDVPPNARELAARAGAEIVESDPLRLADGIERVLADADVWSVRREAALSYARRFDWEALLPPVLTAVCLGEPRASSETPR